MTQLFRCFKHDFNNQNLINILPSDFKMRGIGLFYMVLGILKWFSCDLNLLTINYSSDPTMNFESQFSNLLKKKSKFKIRYLISWTGSLLKKSYGDLFCASYATFENPTIYNIIRWFEGLAGTNDSLTNGLMFQK